LLPIVLFFKTVSLLLRRVLIDPSTFLLLSFVAVAFVKRESWSLDWPPHTTDSAVTRLPDVGAATPIEDTATADEDTADVRRSG